MIVYNFSQLCKRAGVGFTVWQLNCRFRARLTASYRVAHSFFVSMFAASFNHPAINWTRYAGRWLASRPNILGSHGRQKLFSLNAWPLLRTHTHTAKAQDYDVNLISKQLPTITSRQGRLVAADTWLCAVGNLFCVRPFSDILTLVSLRGNIRKMQQ